MDILSFHPCPALADETNGGWPALAACPYAYPAGEEEQKEIPHMPFMVWNDRISVGIEELDADHKRMVELINELYEAIIAGHGRKELDSHLDRLVDYTHYHFAREEELFSRTGYPDAAAHKREHDEMAAWIKNAAYGFRSGSLAAPSLEVMNHLKDWLFDHILGSDQKFVPHMQAHHIR